MINSILNKFNNGEVLDKKELCELLSIEIGSHDYYNLLFTANQYSRKTFSNKGIVFAQIGLDSQPCHINCRFCTLAKNSMKNKQCIVRSIDDVVNSAKVLSQSGIEDLFLMTTAEFSQDDFLKYGVEVRKVIPEKMRLVANVADFDLEYAKKLKSVGFTGVYHIHRLGEGLDTGAKSEDRIKTMQAVKDSGLELYYCVEPIGPEHTNDAIVEEMIRPRNYPVNVMAVMRRIAVSDTPLGSCGEISSASLAQICATATLAMRPKRAMGVHEPDEFCLMAGANQLYAEVGSNPRDTSSETSENRGFSTLDARAMLSKTEWS